MEQPAATPATLSQAGFHNDHMEFSRGRLIKAASFKDLSTVILVPATSKGIPPRVVNAWWGLMHPMNQATLRLFIEGAEVADAYNKGLQYITSDPAFSKIKFLMTIEHDNIPPPDGHVRLAGDMYSCKLAQTEEELAESPFAGIGALYWTKGEGGQPMIYGDPAKYDPANPLAVNFEPCQIAKPEGVQECNGIAMGFSIYDMNLFRDRRLQLAPGKWFDTPQEYIEYKGVRHGTQDLEFCGRARQLGYRFAVDTTIKVGHFDFSSGITW